MSPPSFVLEGHATLDSFLDAAREQRHDVLLLDWNLRAGLGTRACALLREEGETRPIVITSGCLETEFARDEAREAGASEFIDKTSSVEEWRLRLARLASCAPYRSRSRVSGVHKLDVQGHTASVELRDGAAILHAYRVALRPLEFDLLEHLLERIGTVVSSASLIAAIWKEPLAQTAEGVAAQKARVATTMNRLRRSLGASADMIETTRGGYRIRSARARAQGE